MSFANNFSAFPTPSFGYYRGNPQYGGTGSGMGANVAGTKAFAAGQGPQTVGNTGWEPSILYLFALVIAEMFVFAFIARHL